MAFYQSSTYGPDRAIGYLVRVISHTTLAHMEPLLAAEGLTSTQWQVLTSLYFGRSRTCAMLARELSHDKGAMTRLADLLEERGLIRRERDADDRRVLTLALTPAGRDAVEKGRDLHVTCWNRWLADWEPAEVETLIAMLKRLGATIEAAPEECA